MPSMSGLICSLVLALSTTGCASVFADVPLSKNFRLQGVGRGSKAAAEVKCLRPDAVKQLTGGEIPDDAPAQSCYTVVIISSDSSSIAKAITSYTNAERELYSKVAP